MGGGTGRNNGETISLEKNLRKIPCIYYRRDKVKYGQLALCNVADEVKGV